MQRASHQTSHHNIISSSVVIVEEEHHVVEEQTTTQRQHSSAFYCVAISYYRNLAGVLDAQVAVSLNGRALQVGLAASAASVAAGVSGADILVALLLGARVADVVGVALAAVRADVARGGGRAVGGGGVAVGATVQVLTQAQLRAREVRAQTAAVELAMRAAAVAVACQAVLSVEVLIGTVQAASGVQAAAQILEARADAGLVGHGQVMQAGRLGNTALGESGLGACGGQLAGHLHHAADAGVVADTSLSHELRVRVRAQGGAGSAKAHGQDEKGGDYLHSELYKIAGLPSNGCVGEQVCGGWCRVVRG